ncbi:SDR family NAD(P)-dependent oxidoreductase [Enterococcus sp. BWM-S5]|uniref:SDR family NAD(P)-dependent oxidoreductase n=1 Tax=Enterococcus larvae TaxID=2794352 RepID=A0ABS4CMI5_9ENTE|nr:SDR family NAD(P)-dependent oxidoreductase [Enterococcus larvae]MBP1047660.1 SDR family NAD(P)-dependent oxidoreductase [Enterococcus larvae]
MKKYVAITGASSGIGYSLAGKFAEQGKHLILIARREERLIMLKNKLLRQYPNLEIIIKPTDLTNSKRVVELFEVLERYFIEAWINNAGVGHYGAVQEQSLTKTKQLLSLNVEAVTILSTLYVEKYRSEKGTQLINVSSAGGYVMVPNAVTYCAAKFYVSAFTEALGLELRANNSPLQAKVFAPAATKTEFGQIANSLKSYNYDKAFERYHSSEETAEFLMELYQSEQLVGLVDRKTFSFKLTDNQFPYANDSSANQTLTE